ncbi:MAG: prepilin-type N-terminal cleavage/methylation domain-containing protein [Opitutaceae bacterium]|jgi:prepilin-type N-terminal cleavage/methylation domain-containing protein
MTTPTTTPAVRNKARGFTLVELLVAATIGAFATTAAIAFTLQGLKIYAANVNQLSVNKDLRKLTLNLQNDAAFATNFYIYDTATNGDPTTDNNIVPEQSGNLLLLVSTTTSYVNTAPTGSNNIGASFVSRVVAYYSPVDSGPVYRIDSGIIQNTTANPAPSAATSAVDLYTTYIKPNLSTGASLITSMSGVAENTLVDPTTQKVTPQAHKNLFFYLGPSGTPAGTGAFMVESTVQEQQDLATAANVQAYNLTLWPRG